jgi:hypothetical protein
MNPAASKQNGRREYTKHGLTTLKKTVKQLGNRVIDKRTTTGRELAKVAQRSHRRLGRFGDGKGFLGNSRW